MKNLIGLYRALFAEGLKRQQEKVAGEGQECFIENILGPGGWAGQVSKHSCFKIEAPPGR